MASKQPENKATSKVSFIQLDVNTEKKKISLPAKRSVKSLADLVKLEYKKLPAAIIPYLTLSAGATKVEGKGYLNAINCRNCSADVPCIDFLPQGDFGGKIEVWLQNVSLGDSFTVQFRVMSSSSGNWEIASSETAHFQTAINPVSQSIDFLIPPVTLDSGLALITLEPLFTNSGSWIFNDVIINKISF